MWLRTDAAAVCPPDKEGMPRTHLVLRSRKVMQMDVSNRNALLNGVHYQLAGLTTIRIK